MIRPHETPHLPDLIPEDLHTVNAIEVLRTAVFVLFHRLDKPVKLMGQ